MQNTAFRRGAVAASAVSLALLLSACGGDDKKDDAAKGDTKKSDAKSAPAKTQAELDKLIVASADVKPMTSEARPASEVADAQVATSDKAECTALSKLMVGGTPGEPKALVIRRVSDPMPKEGEKKADNPEDEAKAALEALEKMKSMTMNQVGLGSYEGDGAEKAMADLKQAGEKCAAGFTSKVKSDSTKVNKVTADTYTGGDESLAYTLVSEAEGMKMSVPVVAVRKGNEVFTVVSINLSGKGEMPKAIVDAQLKKLG
ncbi:hypothetical protein [Streptomyces sp. NPDC058953]|uniref:hypothetical protein n=1 Tax=unclassified Streptomyces TaxID=2593676 RepID=UPI003689E581